MLKYVQIFIFKIMIETIKEVQFITCDKCGITDSELESKAGLTFFNNGWQMNPKGIKYIHLCKNCQTKKMRKAHDLIYEKFRRNNTKI